MSASVRLLTVLSLLLLCAPAGRAHIIITQPNGGETYFAGEVVPIRWCIAITHTLQNWDLRYHTALPGTTPGCTNVTGGFTVIELDVPPTCSGPGSGGICFLGPDPPCCMEYLWTVPDGIDSDEMKIKIRMDNAGTDYFDLSDEPFTVMSTVSAPQPAGALMFLLEQNQPNPFRATTETMISYVLDRPATHARLLVLDARGAVVKRLVDHERPSGRHTVLWDGTDQGGERVASGVYFYRLEAGQRSETRRMVVLR